MQGFSFNEAFFIVSCIDAIPSQWSKVLRNGKKNKFSETKSFYTCRLLKGSRIEHCKLKQKMIYTGLITRFSTTPTAQINFSKKYPNQNFDWEKMYLLPFEVTIDSQTRWFQYKILHNILYTNKALAKMRKIGTAKCTFCHNEVESAEHLLVFCDFSHRIRVNLVIWLQTLDISLPLLSEIDIIFGTRSKDHWKLINHLILIAKQTIYHARVKNILPSFENFKSRVLSIAKIESTIAKSRGKLGIHYQKWDKLLCWLDSI